MPLKNQENLFRILTYTFMGLWLVMQATSMNIYAILGSICFFVLGYSIATQDAYFRKIKTQNRGV